MRIFFGGLFVVMVGCLGLSGVDAQVPQIINYQGRVVVGTTNFTGTGQFKFALVNAAGNVTYWSNTASSGGAEPPGAVSITVSNGLYSVVLGDTTIVNMTAIPPTVFNNSDVRLRVWFNNGVNGSQLLSPDQRIAAVGYAMVASSINGAVPATQVTGLLPANQIGAGTISSAVNFANASTPFTVGNTNKIVNLNSDLLDGLDSGAFVKRAGDTMLGDLAMGNFGLTARFVN